MKPLVRAGWTVAAVACLWPWSPPPPPAGGLALRLVGPFSSLAASVEWVRFDGALLHGRMEHAYARAERALELDPRTPQGWIHLATHLVHDRGSAEATPDAAERRRWIAAGIDVLERGESLCRAPEELAWTRGLLWTWIADSDGPTGLGWPGGPAAAVREAVGALERAAGLGHPRAAELIEALGRSPGG